MGRETLLRALHRCGLGALLRGLPAGYLPSRAAARAPLAWDVIGRPVGYSLLRLERLPSISAPRMCFTTPVCYEPISLSMLVLSSYFTSPPVRTLDMSVFILRPQGRYFCRK